MEGTCALIAMGMLLWTSNWMLNKSSVEAWNRYIRKKTEAAVLMPKPPQVPTT